MKKIQKNSFLTYTLGVILLFASFVFISKPVYADTDTYTTRVIKKNEITRIATFPISGTSLQGNTITKDYYVYSDLKNNGNDSTGQIVLVDRTNCEKVKTIEASTSYEKLHMSGLYNEWDSNYVYLTNNAFDTSASRDSCYNLSTGKKVSKSKCPSRPTYVEIPELKSEYYTSHAYGVWQGQGSTFYHNGYYFRVIWEHHSSNESLTNTFIYVFKDRTTVLKRYKIPSSLTPECTKKYESEDISVDGDTGDVYIGYNCSKKAIYYKINSSVFGDYTKGSSDKARKVAVCAGFGQVEKMITVGKNKTSSTSSSNSTSKNNTKNDTSKKTKTSTTSKSTTQNSTSSESTTSSSNNSNSSGDNCVKTAVLGGGEVCDDGKGSSTLNILKLVIEIMSIGVGILGVLGIIIVGIQYLTAGGNEEKTRKAKRRMLEIIIGLVAYVLIYALLKWLIPDFNTP